MKHQLEIIHVGFMICNIEKKWVWRQVQDAIEVCMFATKSTKNYLRLITKASTYANLKFKRFRQLEKIFYAS